MDDDNKRTQVQEHERYIIKRKKEIDLVLGLNCWEATNGLLRLDEETRKKSWVEMVHTGLSIKMVEKYIDELGIVHGSIIAGHLGYECIRKEEAG